MDAVPRGTAAEGLLAAQEGAGGGHAAGAPRGASSSCPITSVTPRLVHIELSITATRSVPMCWQDLTAREWLRVTEFALNDMRYLQAARLHLESLDPSSFGRCTASAGSNLTP